MNMVSRCVHNARTLSHVAIKWVIERRNSIMSDVRTLIIVFMNVDVAIQRQSFLNVVFDVVDDMFVLQQCEHSIQIEGTTWIQRLHQR